MLLLPANDRDNLLHVRRSQGAALGQDLPSSKRLNEAPSQHKTEQVRKDAGNKMPLASASRRAPEPGAVDFIVSSSLPPMVAGVVAGEMELSVPCLYPKPGVLCSTRYLRDRQSEPMFAVRMMWWGDGGPGIVLKPTLLSERDDSGEMARRVRSSRATCALFPVRCGVDGLVAYLKDMVRASDKLNLRTF